MRLPISKPTAALVQLSVPLAFEARNQFGLLIIGQVIDELDEFVAYRHCQQTELCRIGSSQSHRRRAWAPGRASSIRLS